MSFREHEVVVLGGGPAGAAASILLARRGHDVGLVHPSAPPAGGLAESVPPSARKLLAEIGALDAIERSGFQPNLGNTVWWGGGQPRTECFENDRGGFHVDRAGLERVLVEAARDAAVTIHDRWTARSAAEGEGRWAVQCTADERALELRAPWVLDATGRRGLIATREGRVADRGTTTVALVRRWRRRGGFGGADPTHTLVESYLDGWAWSVPLAPEVRCFTVMVDHRHASLAGANLDAALDRELDKSPHIGGLRSGAEPCESAWACSASLYTSGQFGRPGLLLVGDAGSFIDPLSSFGVKKALSSGWLGAVAVHTALVDPTMAGVAADFFDRREREVYANYRGLAADFFEAGARAHGHVYWSERASAAREAAGGPAEAADPDALEDLPIPESAVRAAHETIRALERLHAARGSSLRSLSRPAIVGHRIVLDEHLMSDRVPKGIRYVRGVDLRRLVEIAPVHGEVPDGWKAYNRGAPPVALPDYLTALAAAFAAGFLEHRGVSRD